LNAKIFTRRTPEHSYQEALKETTDAPDKLLRFVVAQVNMIDNSAQDRYALAEGIVAESIKMFVTEPAKEIKEEDKEKQYALMSTATAIDNVIQAKANEAQKKIAQDYPLLTSTNDDPVDEQKYKNEMSRLKNEAMSFGIKIEEGMQEKMLLVMVVCARLSREIKNGLEKLVRENLSDHLIPFSRSKIINDIYMAIDHDENQYIDMMALSRTVLGNNTVEAGKHYFLKLTDADFIKEIKSRTDLLYETLAFPISDNPLVFALQNSLTQIRVVPFRDVRSNRGEDSGAEDMYATMVENALQIQVSTWDQKNNDEKSKFNAACQAVLKIGTCDARIRYMNDRLLYLKKLPAHYHTGALQSISETLESLVYQAKRIEGKILEGINGLKNDDISEIELKGLNRTIDRCLGLLEHIKIIEALSERALLNKDNRSDLEILQVIKKELDVILQEDRDQKPSSTKVGRWLQSHGAHLTEAVNVVMTDTDKKITSLEEAAGIKHDNVFKKLTQTLMGKKSRTDNAASSSSSSSSTHMFLTTDVSGMASKKLSNTTGSNSGTGPEKKQ
jgi:hypothetical protein